MVAAHIKRLANRSAKAHIDRFGVILPCLPSDVRVVAGGHRQATIRPEVTASEAVYFMDESDISRERTISWPPS